MPNPEGLMSLLPLNARTFTRNILRDRGDTSSLISAEDLSDDEVEEIYRRIDFQEAHNAYRERGIQQTIDFLERHREEYPNTPHGSGLIRSGEYFDGAYGYDPDLPILTGNKTQLIEPDLDLPDPSEEALSPRTFIPDNPNVISGKSELSDEERFEINLDAFNEEVQAKLDKEMLRAESFDKTRGKTSVGYYGDPDSMPAHFFGPNIVKTIVDSFTSPAYNINTTLGHFNAFKNEDGTVTIRDTYNWTGQEDDPYETDYTMPEFLKALPIMIMHPEAAGNVLMRTGMTDKYSPVEFTLPPRGEGLSTDTSHYEVGETKERFDPLKMLEAIDTDYRDGGRVRLI